MPARSVIVNVQAQADCGVPFGPPVAASESTLCVRTRDLDFLGRLGGNPLGAYGGDPQ